MICMPDVTSGIVRKTSHYNVINCVRDRSVGDILFYQRVPDHELISARTEVLLVVMYTTEDVVVAGGRDLKHVVIDDLYIEVVHLWPRFP